MLEFTSSGSGTLPITLAEVKLHLRVTWTTEDDLITHLLWDSIRQVEQDSGTCIVTRHCRENFLTFPCEPFQLIKRPVDVSSIVINYYAGSVLTAYTDFYATSPAYVPSKIYPVSIYPVIATPYPRPDQVTISYTAGPLVHGFEHARRAVLLLVGDWYWHRENQGTVSNEIQTAYYRLVTKLDKRGI